MYFLPILVLKFFNVLWKLLQKKCALFYFIGGPAAMVCKPSAPYICEDLKSRLNEIKWS